MVCANDPGVDCDGCGERYFEDWWNYLIEYGPLLFCESCWSVRASEYKKPPLTLKENDE